jgi:hypothetical protein
MILRTALLRKKDETIKKGNGTAGREGQKQE